MLKRKYMRRLALVVVMTMGLITSMFTSVTAAVPNNPLFGMSQGSQPLGLSDSALNAMLDKAAATGALYFRIDIDWHTIQAGGSTSYNWTDTDRVINAAINKGFKIIGLITYSPGWANGGESFFYLPDNTTDYGNFCYEVAQRYMPLGVDVFQLWNEANISGESATSYIKYTSNVLIPGYTKIKQAGTQLGKSSTVLTCALAGWQTDSTKSSPMDYLNGIYDYGGQGYFDAVAYHPYMYSVGNGDPYTVDDDNWLLRTSEMYDIMYDNGDGAKEIWATEMGFPTSTAWNGCTEAEQSDYMNKTFCIWQDFSPWAGPMVWYCVKNAGTDAANNEDNFGLVRYNDTYKPAYYTFCDIIENGPVPTPEPVLENNAVYKIIAKHSDKAIQISQQSTSNGVLLDQWEYSGATCQQWKAIYLGDGYYEFVNEYSNKCMDVYGIYTTDGAAIHQWDYLNQDNQKWLVDDMGDGYCKVTAKHSGKSLTVTGAGTANGINLEQRTDSGLDSQRFQFINLSGGPTPTPILTPEPTPTPTPTPTPAGMILASSFSSCIGITTESCSEGGLNTTNWKNGNWAKYSSIDLGSGKTVFTARVAASTSAVGEIWVRLDSTIGPLIGQFTATATGGLQAWEDQTCALSGGTGVHDIYLTCVGGGGTLICNIQSFRFDGGTPAPTVTPGAPTPTPEPTTTPTPTPAGMILASSFSSCIGITTENCSEGGLNTTNWKNGNWAKYSSIDLGSGKTVFTARVAASTSAVGEIWVRLDSTTGPLIGQFTATATGGLQVWENQTCTLSGGTGVHNIYLTCVGGGGTLICNIKEFSFE